VCVCQIDDDTAVAQLDEDTSPSSTPALILPVCWTKEQYLKFITDNDWLFVANGKLGCSACSAIANLPGCTLTVSDEWADGMIGPYGASNKAQQTALRKKIYEHKNSRAHNNACRLLAEQKSNAIQEAVSVQSQRDLDETCRIFLTAYFIAKNDRPYSDHPDLVALQQINGLNMGRILQSNVVCADIIDHIADDMRSNLCNFVRERKCHVSILIDESTTLSRISCLVVYLRTTFDEQVGPVSCYLDLIELSSTTAEGIESALLTCLAKHGFTDEYLYEHWIGLGADGASVMLGKKAGVATKLQLRYPRITAWHCLNHRLELSVGDAIKSCSEVNHFKSFLDSLYTLYSQSPKCQRELSECANELQLQLNKIGRIFDVRWVSSSYRTVRAVWRSYEALYKHFCDKAADDNVDSREKAKYAGLAKKLESQVFIRNLGLMHDALEELSDLSLALQKTDITLSNANKLISRQIEILEARKDAMSTFYQECCIAIDSGAFKGVKIATSSGKDREISKGQFYQALADSMRARLLPQSEKVLISAASAVDSALFPPDLTPEFGETEVRFLCDKFDVSFSDVKQDYREYKSSKGLLLKPCLQKLKNCVDTLPVSTAECERGFSKMNIVCSSLRSALTVKHISSLLFVSLCGPPISIWKPAVYVKSWLAKGRRDANTAQGPARSETIVSNKLKESMWTVL
jgi:hypothetical protein